MQHLINYNYLRKIFFVYFLIFTFKIKLYKETRQGKVCAYLRIKSHVPRHVQTSVNSFEFQSCDRTAQAECLRVGLNKKI
jgi:hypothetical protein